MRLSLSPFLSERPLKRDNSSWRGRRSSGRRRRRGTTTATTATTPSYTNVGRARLVSGRPAVNWELNFSSSRPLFIATRVETLARATRRGWWNAWIVALIKMITSDFSRSFHPRFVQKIELVFPPPCRQKFVISVNYSAREILTGEKRFWLDRLNFQIKQQFKFAAYYLIIVLI